MRRLARFVLLVTILLSVGCNRIDIDHPRIPDGEPVTILLGFGAPIVQNLEVGTRAESTAVDEAHIHDLYVLIFKENESTHVWEKFYGRFFSYEHQVTKIELNNSINECWFVENQTINGVANAVAQTRGAVKISTSSCANARIIVIANVSNTLTNLDGTDPLTRLNEISTLAELQNAKVTLTQDVVVRKDYFLMMSDDMIDTGSMRWNTNAANSVTYNNTYKISLKRLDAKVKFRIKVNTNLISAINPRFWQVCKAPSGCYLFDTNSGGPDANADPSVFQYFDTEETYFEGTEEDGTYQVFAFYMLENMLSPIRSVTSYREREQQDKSSPDANGYVKNGRWTYANEYSTYVRFDVILTLKKEAVEELDEEATQALTTDVAFVVHLGDFSNQGVGNFDTARGTSYTYNVTINNSTSIYTEVIRGNEVDPAQEGFLLLIKDGVVNCDAHYEYRRVIFNYRSSIVDNPKKFSWYVKTPFGEGGPGADDVVEVDSSEGIYYYPAPEKIKDYKWVLFALNNFSNGEYTVARKQFPGMGQYRPLWKLDPAHLSDSLSQRPELLDISQLISFIYYQQKQKSKGASNVFDSEEKIHITAFVNEYYYDTNPNTGELETELWRTFVNAKPREMHILSDVETSADQKSDVITSSQSIIQQSIQTIYNVYNHELKSIWGTEHKDEMREMKGDSPWETNPWPFGTPQGFNNNEENGRLNTSIMWGVSGGTTRWDKFLDYEVDNDIPELKSTPTNYRGLFYSCLSRNRDNNGNGIIDPEEVRWYTASINQLIGMYIGGEAISPAARLYQPPANHWRSHVVSSTLKSNNNPRCLTSEEGIATYWGGGETWMKHDDGSQYTQEEKNRIRTVRCVRNVGTINSGGTTVDISEAPLSSIPDEYYTYTKTGDGDDAFYTYRFDRLDPKALRAYTANDLPYHDEKSAHNRLYQKMITQSINQNVSISKSVKLKDVNQTVTNAGVNPYCPAGYRIPNQMELAMMTMTVDDRETYFPTKHPEGVDSRFFCRTYYSKGYFAKSGEQVYTERNKIGWVWGASKINCSEKDHNGMMTRCVKDDNLTGTITGDIFLSNTTICPGDVIDADFKFISSAASLNYATLKLCYTVDGIYKEKNVILNTEPSGVQYVFSQDIQIPSWTSLGISEAADLLDSKITLKLDLRNSVQGMIVQKDLFVRATQIQTSARMAGGWDDVKGFPVAVSARSKNNRVTFSTEDVRIRWKTTDSDTWTSTDNLITTTTGVLSNELFYFKPSPLEQKTYQVQVYIQGKETDADSHAETDADSYQYSMALLRANFDPSTVTDRKWADTATDLDYKRGDFIEARILFTNQGSARQGLLSICNDRIDHWEKNRMPEGERVDLYGVHVYYRDGGNKVIRVSWPKGATTQVSENTSYTASEVILRFDQGGLSYNDIPINPSTPTGWYSDYLNKIATFDTMVVGQMEGSNRPYSTYPYIRVVHQENADANWTPAP